MKELKEQLLLEKAAGEKSEKELAKCRALLKKESSQVQVLEARLEKTRAELASRLSEANTLAETHKIDVEVSFEGLSAHSWLICVVAMQANTRELQKLTQELSLRELDIGMLEAKLKACQVN